MQNKTETIWRSCSNGLKYFIVKRITDPRAAEDILQEVFIKVHTKIDTLKDDTKVCSWVYQIARNEIVNHYRIQKNGFVDIDTLHLIDEDRDETPVQIIKSENAAAVLFSLEDELSAEQEIASGLRKTVESLPAKYSEALLLVEFEGLSQTDLAKKLGISTAGAKSRVQRGRQMLKDALMQCCHFEFDHYGKIIDSHPIKCCCCNPQKDQ